MVTHLGMQNAVSLVREDRLDYPIVRSTKRRTLAIHIRHGEVTIRAPQNLPLKTIHQFIATRKSWIDRMLARDSASPALGFEDGVLIPIMGRTTRVSWHVDSKAQVQLGGDCLLVPISKQVKQRSTYALKQFDSWLVTLANAQLPQRVSQAALQLNVAHKLRHITFKVTRSKWGHCTHLGDIQIHPRIMMAPTNIQNYLIAHEVAHLAVLNHSRAFWQQVAQLDPDYLLHRQWLKDHQHETLMLHALKSPVL